MISKKEVEKEGHAREFQDRARVVDDVAENLETPSSPNQSPQQQPPEAGVTRKNDGLKEKNNENY